MELCQGGTEVLRKKTRHSAPLPATNPTHSSWNKT